MSSVNGVTYVDGTSTTTATATKELGKDEFLQLLIEQLTHQDPTEPMSNEDFVAQLAQFSSLEQLENMNSSLNESLNWDYLLSQTISNTMATSLIGRTVRADSSQVYLQTAGAADIAVNLDRTTTDLTITITDENGTVVRTITKNGMDQGDHVINWDGTDDSGVQVASGLYTVSVSATDANGNTYTPSQYMEGQVEGVIYKDGYALLRINGQDIPLSSVNEVKEG
ncbi:MAG: flagellar hook capping FlgD N-terminal domain-containing protein [Candidatus Zixiibacteriota bacterium]